MSNIRSVFISDCHLGSQFAHTDQLLRYLKWVKDAKPDYLYIVGDFIDGWKLSRNWWWSNDCNLVIRKLLSIVKSGTEVRYVAGNHDEFLRYFLGESSELLLGNIHIKDEFIHEDVFGRHYLVIHGDRFDAALRYAMRSARWLCYCGDVGYDFMIRFNGIVNWVRRHLGMPYWSLSSAIKLRFKQAINYIGGFEQILSSYAEDRKCFGVICGHIHHARRDVIAGIDYINCGDWVESCTAVVEYRDGTFIIQDHFIDYNKKSVDKQEVVNNL